MDQGGSASLMPQDQWRHAFGVSFVPRWGNEMEMHWSRTYRETCGCPLDESYWTSALYDPLAMLFHGVQAAGPRLTPQNFTKGMHAIPPRASGDPYTPAAYFTSGNYSFVKDAMEIWWDPSGRAPGQSAPGCYRLPGEGRRYRVGEWPRGDADVFGSGPCNGHAPAG